MKKFLALAAAILIATPFISSAQNEQEDWKANPTLHNVNPAYANESAVIVSDDRVHEIKQDSKNDMWLYTYNHRIIKVNDDKGVELYNKIYVFVPYNAEVVTIKARAIQRNGTVVNLPESKIFDVEEEGKKYKKFAIEGSEKGSEIEYLTCLKKPVATFGLEMFSSGNSYYENASFTLIVPEHLVFTVKGYNGFQVNNENLVNSKRVIISTSKNIEPLDEEKYAEAGPYYQNVQYKLSYNLDKDKTVRLFTWNELAKNVYNNYNSFESKELKAIDNFYKQIKISDGLSEEEKIIRIEDYLKTNINTEENTTREDADQIEKIVKTKVAGNFGFTRLFVGLLQKAGVTSQIVFPSKRDDLPLDENFENYRLIDDLIFYFPSTGKFLDPVNATFRYPFIQPYWAGTRGLFLKGTTIGDFKTALARFDTIPIQPYEKSATNMEVSLKFNDNMDSVLLHSKQSLLGYSAVYYRPAYNFLPKDKQDEFTKEIVQSVAQSEQISNIQIENQAMTDGSKDIPLNIIADIASAALIEKAGNKLLLKVGDVIGPQVQMYQEKQRRLPIIIQYPHSLDRVIHVSIPKGYKVKNMDEINFNVVDKNSAGQETMGFVSTFKQEADVITITVHEFYKEISYPVSKIDDYRKVVNAAADFNKVTLVFEKL